MTMTVDELVDNFSLLDDWEDRYAYVIDLGKKLEPMPEAEKTEEAKVKGCMSQVWLAHDVNRVDGETHLHFRADSDAFIVKGLIAVLMELYNDRRPSEILETDAVETLGKIGLSSHLSPNRRNGFVAMVDRIKAIAADHATG
jgi:cysteine desulfuration protein SufE